MALREGKLLSRSGWAVIVRSAYPCRAYGQCRSSWPPSRLGWSAGKWAGLRTPTVAAKRGWALVVQVGSRGSGRGDMGGRELAQSRAAQLGLLGKSAPRRSTLGDLANDAIDHVSPIHELAIGINRVDDPAAVEGRQSRPHRLNVGHLSVKGTYRDRPPADEVAPGRIPIPVEPPGTHASRVQGLDERQAARRVAPVKCDGSVKRMESCHQPRRPSMANGFVPFGLESKRSQPTALYVRGEESAILSEPPGKRGLAGRRHP